MDYHNRRITPRRVPPIATSNPAETIPDGALLAAVDIGSNSFHLIVARVTSGQLHIVDRLRETVRLATGLDKRNQLTVAAQNRALACLHRFGQRLKAMTPGSVRCVGTNALRRARNAEEFLVRAMTNERLWERLLAGE